MSVKVVEWLEWPAPNRPGVMLKFAETFRKKKVNLDAFGAVTSGGKGRICAIAKRSGQLKAALRAMKVKTHTSRGFYLAGKDRAGALVGALRKLAKARINVDCAEAIAAQGKFGALLCVNPRSFGRARRVLRG